MKRFVYIFIFIIGLNFTSFAQNKPGSSTPADGGPKLLKLYPIPASSVINFDFVSGYDKSLSFQIYNFTGKVVYELKSPPQKINLSLADFSRGFYYYQLRDAGGRLLETARFLVVK
ncbi:MAG: T9SS type A sorting domain-containing protein [Bacteroidetes bacterium]|nr:T9SS type A sorting domain-containing protein [Bacteroidota bacterium]